MGQYATDELVSHLTETVPAITVIKEVSFGLFIPQADVEMTPVSRLVWKRLGGEGCVKIVLSSDVANRFAIYDVVVGGSKGVRVADGQFLLSVAEFWVILLHLEALGVQRNDNVVYDRHRLCHPNTAET